ncbi:hypothetical protein [Alkalibacillus haloalkaliphilus]|uniref:Uncharacterized protein n=1 Tax=Alkalibacillus haloalkaliphilus TaxID=94136 RepID=A0A511W299_9BACI|nr:hypothetical protein [Alkalibacillus haloalkaliphilus]GEN44891.1 hypothetical protein AHA02nite_06670 [Alkalibacillus haloalkaliphilus]
MRKFAKVLSSALVFSMLITSPLVISAHHDGSNWETHYTYYQCIDGSGYHKFEEQHRHIGDRQEFRTINERVSTACPI